MVLLWGSFSSVALAQTKLWDTSFGGSSNDNLHDMVQTPDGGYLLGGSSNSDISGDKSQNSRGKEDYWVVKLDVNKNKVYDKTFGGSEADILTAMIATTDGYLLAGTSASDITGDKTNTSRGMIDYWVVKIDDNGNKIWDKCFGGSNNDILKAIIATPDGGYLLGGTSLSDIGGDKSQNGTVWVIKIDDSGEKIWDKTFKMGGKNFNSFELASLVTSQDGGFLLIGNANNNGYVVKVDEQGNKVWENSFKNDSFNFLETAVAITDGGFLLGGYSHDDNYYSLVYRYWVVKINKSGDTMWSKTFAAGSNSILSDLVLTPDGDFLLAGSSGLDYPVIRNYMIVKINSQGNKVWERTLIAENDDQLQAALFTTDGGFLLGGTSLSGKNSHKTQESQGGTDYWVVKLDNSGKVRDQFITLKLADRATDEPPFTVVDTTSLGLPLSLSIVSGPATLNGNILSLTGATGTVTVKAMQAGNSTYLPAEMTKTFQVKLHPALKQWNKTLGGSESEQLQTILATPDGGYLLGGSSFSGVGGDKSVASQGSYDYWVVKIDASNNKVWDKTFGGSASDELHAMVATPDGGYLLGGTSESGISGDKTQAGRGGNDYWIIKIDADGNKRWDKSFGGINGPVYDGNSGDKLTALLVTADGDYLLGGTSESDIGGDRTHALNGYFDIWVVKINSAGEKVWDKAFGNWEQASLGTMIAAPDGGYVLGGTLLSGGFEQFWIIKIDEDGTQIWDKELGGNGYNFLRALVATSDGGYLLGGSATLGFDDEGQGPGGDRSEALRSEYSDYWVIKVDGEGKRYGIKHSAALVRTGLLL